VARLYSLKSFNWESQTIRKMKKGTVILLSMGVLYNVLAQYPSIRIADAVVIPENQGSITSDYITGTIRYDSASRTLIFQDATIYRCDDPSETYKELFLLCG
jgi:hypothetical protein